VPTAGGTGGPLQMMFAPIFGVHTFDLSAQAVAMISFPSGMPVGAVFLLAAAPGPFKASPEIPRAPGVAPVLHNLRVGFPPRPQVPGWERSWSSSTGLTCLIYPIVPLRNRLAAVIIKD